MITIISRVYLPLALGYALSYFYRNANAIIEQDLVAELSLTASSLGLLTSMYFISFAACQIPVGMWLDRYGPRKTEAGLLLFAAVGAVIFSQAHSLAGLMVGRLLIGVGVSACLMAAFKAYTLWFSKDQLPTINGFQMMAGGLGALAATAPLQSALDVTNWRTVFVGLAVISVAISALLFFAYPKTKAPNQSESPESIGALWEGIVHILQSRAFWTIAPICMFSQATFMAVQGLWIRPWLRDVIGMSAEKSANTLFAMTLAMIAGFLLLGMLSTQLRKRFALSTVTFSITMMTVFMAIQAVIISGYPNATLPLMLGFSFFATSGILPYAALSQQFDNRLAGRVNTLLNLTVFVCAFAFQWGMGMLIDLWHTTDSGGHSLISYQTAFGCAFVLQAIGLGWWFKNRRFV
ncbi:MAG: MFS transporter [Gammaproteobacteria bacterium]|nr:MFS transporter [Gammaproteobacteria bacterium]